MADLKAEQTERLETVWRGTYAAHTAVNRAITALNSGDAESAERLLYTASAALAPLWGQLNWYLDADPGSMIAEAMEIFALGGDHKAAAAHRIPSQIGGDLADIAAEARAVVKNLYPSPRRLLGEEIPERTDDDREREVLQGAIRGIEEAARRFVDPLGHWMV